MAGESIGTLWRALVDRVVGECRSALGNELVAAALFGSVARGEARPDSDLDLYVVTRTRISLLSDPRWDEVRRVRESTEHRALVAAGYRAQLALLPHSVEELRAHPWILLDITDHGMILHDPEGILGRELDAVRRRLRELGSKRIKRPDGTWYWDLKPDWRPGEVIEL
jgi:hypothetical protein